MRNVIFMLFVIIILSACSSGGEEQTKKFESKPIDEKHSIPLEEQRISYIESDKYIEAFEDIYPEGDEGQVSLILKMNDDFAQLKISEQYLHLVDFYEGYNEKFKILFPTYNFLNKLNAYIGDADFPAYRVNLKTFEIVAENVDIDRLIGSRPDDSILELLDMLDKESAMSGTKAGLTLAEVEEGKEPAITHTLITSSGEVRGVLAMSHDTDESDSSSQSKDYSGSGNDTETYIEGMTGFDWVNLTDNQKFHAVSNALFSLDQNGYDVFESESFYMEALDAFYTDSSTMSTSVDTALASIGAMSNTFVK